MIKLVGQIDGRPIVLLGLSENNLKKLREGLPIHIFGKEMEVAVDIVIFAGKDETDLTKMVQPLLDKATVVQDRRKEKKQ